MTKRLMFRRSEKTLSEPTASSESLATMIETGFAALFLRPARVLFFTAFVVAMLCLSPQLAFAQGKPPATNAAAASSGGGKPPAKRTTVNFEDQLIEGQTAKPELFYLLQQRSPNFKRLIKLRENFIPEMQDTAEDMNRSGNGH